MTPKPTLKRACASIQEPYDLTKLGIPARLGRHAKIRYGFGLFTQLVRGVPPVLARWTDGDLPIRQTQTSWFHLACHLDQALPVSVYGMAAPDDPPHAAEDQEPLAGSISAVRSAFPAARRCRGAKESRCAGQGPRLESAAWCWGVP